MASSLIDYFRKASIAYGKIQITHEKLPAAISNAWAGMLQSRPV